MKYILPLLCSMALMLTTHAQNKNLFYNQEIKLTTSQLGFLPNGKKIITLVPTKETVNKLPNEIPFYIQSVGNRKKRNTPNKPAEWTDNVYRWPFDITTGTYLSTGIQYHDGQGSVLYKGTLKKITSRWGTFWQGEFTDFSATGIYQIETEYAFTTPFLVSEKVYDRLQLNFLNYLYYQRSGTEIWGIREPQNADDAVVGHANGLALPLSGGWNDAGDTRKWLSQTLGNIEALTYLARTAPPAAANRAIEELIWGNNYYYFMINDSGYVYEDVGAGFLRKGMTYENDWWIENHAGCSATGAADGDNTVLNGNERIVRNTYNPLVQYLYIKNQALAATVLPLYAKNKSLILAERAWKYAQKTGHDGRTLFVSEELLAACELFTALPNVVAVEKIKQLVNMLLERQDASNAHLNGFFTEKDNTDAYRSIVYSCEPALALLRFCELKIPGTEAYILKAEKALKKYLENYLLKDAASNPFTVCPYGIYYNPTYTQTQVFRNAGNKRFVRTFIDPLNKQEMVHGTASTINQQAYLFARAYKYFQNTLYKQQAETLIMWNLGHNPYELCLATGVGFKHPVQASFSIYSVPDGHVVGFIGRLDDSPYIEASNAIEWNTQEIWGVPLHYLINAIIWLQK